MSDRAPDRPPAPLLTRLAEPDTAEAAAVTMLASPHWLNQPPPDAVLTAVSNPRTDTEGQVVALARAWGPGQLVPALLDLVASADRPDQRIRAAWIVKQVTDPERAESVLRRALDPGLGPTERRYLIEGVVRASAGVDPSDDHGLTDGFVRAALAELLASREAGTREAAVALVEATVAAPAERRRLLIEALADDSPGVVATALTALRGTGTDGIPAALLAELRSRAPTIALATAELDGPLDA